MAVRSSHVQELAPGCAAVGAGHVDLGPGLVDEDQACRIEVGLALAPRSPSLEHIPSVLLTGVACLLLARHPVADEEALDRAIAEVEPAPGEQTAQFLDGDVGGLGQHAEDDVRMRFDAPGATVSAECSRARIALHLGPPAPAADTRRAHTEARCCGAVAQALGDRRQDPNAKIKGKCFRHVCRPPSRQTV